MVEFFETPEGSTDTQATAKPIPLWPGLPP